MKIYLTILSFCLFIKVTAQVGIGTTTPASSATLDIVSNNSGVLIPRMTTAERLAITTPANSLLVFDNTTTSFWYFDLTNTQWIELKSGGNPLVDADGDTKVDVEETADEDIIRFYTPNAVGVSTNFFSISNGRVKEHNTNRNLIFGDFAGANVDFATHTSNIFMGNSAGATFTGNRNIGLGSATFEISTSGNDNIAIGDHAGQNVGIDAERNILVGTESGNFIDGALNNVFIGHQSGANLQIGIDNSVMIGSKAGDNLSAIVLANLDNNVFIGDSVCSEADAGVNRSVILGGRAGRRMGSGWTGPPRGIDLDRNVLIGYETAEFLDGIHNVVLGSSAGQFMSGDENIIIGSNAAQNARHRNIIIGNNANPGWTVDDKFLINNGVNSILGGDFANQTLGIHTANPQGALHVQANNQSIIFDEVGAGLPSGTSIRMLSNTGNLSFRMRLGNGAGAGIKTWDLRVVDNADDDFVIRDVTTGVDRLEINGATGQVDIGSNGDGSQIRANAFTAFSDRRFKTDIDVLTNALDKLKKINGYTYKWKNKPDRTIQIGVIAQEVEEVLPEIVTTDKDGYKSVAYSRLSVLLIEAMKEQQKIIENQNVKIEKLNQNLKSIDASVNKLEETLKAYLRFSKEN